MRINVSSRLSGAAIAGPLVAAVHRELEHELSRMAVNALRYWRRITPKRTGRLRASEQVNVRRVSPQRHALAFEVTDPGRAYYRAVAARHPKLRGGAGVLKWVDRNTRRYVDRAVSRAVGKP